MAQGLYAGNTGKRFATKKAAKSEMLAAPDTVVIESTSVFGNEYHGSVADMPEGAVVYFVGPDPYTKRTWYGQVSKRNGKIIVT